MGKRKLVLEEGWYMGDGGSKDALFFRGGDFNDESLWTLDHGS